jgi:phospholipid/cholesterol/gamma-HCH transport system substrate-binding protein
MRRTRSTGVVIVLVAALIMYVSYRAQNGLPWQSTHAVRVAVPDAGKLLKNTPVRVGGHRVGQILRIDAVPAGAGAPAHALLHLQLDGGTDPLPVDTTAEVRLASVLGGKYLSLVPGRQRQTIPWDGELPLANSSTSIDIEEAFRIFTPEGRRAIQRFVAGLAGTVAGRGRDMNTTLSTTAALLPGLERVLTTVSAEASDLPGFVRGAAAATSALEATRVQLGPFVGATATTLGALDLAGVPLRESIAELPVTAEAGRRGFAALRPVLDDAAAITRDLGPSARVLPAATREMLATARTAIRVDPAVETLATPMDRTLSAVGRFAANPASTGALRILGSQDLATFGASAFVGLGAVLKTTWDAERACRTVSTWMERIAAIAGDGDEGGNWMRMMPIFETDQAKAEGAPSANLNANPYPNENAQECEAGNEGFASGGRIGNVPGNQGRPESGR